MSTQKKITIFALILIGIGFLFNERLVWYLVVFLGDQGGLSPTQITQIRIFNIIFVVVGGLIYLFRSVLAARIKEIIFTMITFILFLGLLEGGFRVFYVVKNKIIGAEGIISNELGWTTAANAHVKREVKGYGMVDYSTQKDGFRVFGDLTTTDTKIFVIGDSNTKAREVSDGQTYYDYIQQHCDSLEIFAYGGGGYGTLQEYMILDKYYDQIKPDIIIWQFSVNDLINNSYKLESASYINNNRMTRPYYQNGEIVFLYPRQDYGWFYNIVQASYLLKFIGIRIDIIKAEKSKTPDTIEYVLHKDHPLLLETIETTSQIMSLARKKVGDKPIIAFLAGSRKPRWYDHTFENIAKKHDIYFVNVYEQIVTAKNKGIKIDGSPHDAHWNQTGHAIAGQTILEEMIQRGILFCHDNN